MKKSKKFTKKLNKLQKNFDKNDIEGFTEELAKIRSKELTNEQKSQLTQKIDHFLKKSYQADNQDMMETIIDVHYRIPPIFLKEVYLDGNKELVKYLVEHGVSVNSRLCDRPGHTQTDTIFHVATQNNDMEMVKYIIEHGGNINKYGLYGRTPVHIAYLNKNAEMTKYLVENGGNISLPFDYKGPTGYNILVRGGKIEYRLHDHHTPLVDKACVEHNLDSLKELAEVYGADIRNSLLGLACLHKDENIVEYLLDYGLSPNNQKAFEYANPKIRTILEKYGADIPKVGQNSLIHACESNDMNQVKYLVERGADVNHKTKHFGTPLSNACRNDNPNMVKYLLEHGAVETINTPGRYHTPLSMACSSKDKNLALDMIKLGAKIDAPLYSLTSAVEALNYKLLDYLLNEGNVDINIFSVSSGSLTGPRYHSAIHTAAELASYVTVNRHDKKVHINQNYVEMLKYLIERGADIDLGLERYCGPFRRTPDSVIKELQDYIDLLEEKENATKGDSDDNVVTVEGMIDGDNDSDSDADGMSSKIGLLDNNAANIVSEDISMDENIIDDNTYEGNNTTYSGNTQDHLDVLPDTTPVDYPAQIVDNYGIDDVDMTLDLDVMTQTDFI